ncbi:Cerevisin [Spathaspora sp. JA1]|nr:Cerevisin [Spathaspora sp. JA1]
MLVLLAVVYAAVVNALILPNVASFFDINNFFPNVQISLVNSEGGSSSTSSSSSDYLTVDGILSNPINKIIPQHYVIVLKDDLSETQLFQHKTWIETKYHEMSDIATTIQQYSVGSLKSLEFFKIDNFLTGYSGFFSDELIQEVSKNPHVLFVERDSVFKVDEFEVQEKAPWGLARVSHRENNLANGATGEYFYDNEAGEGVTVYVIDTGIKVEHKEFEGRAEWGSAVAFPNIKIDGNGHGTHCAGIIGSKTFGIAKKVNLVAVGVMNLLGTGTTSDIIKGLEFVVSQHQDKIKKKKSGFKGSVVNMSIGGGISEALDLAVNAGTKAGLHIAVAAGNDNQDACQYSPARAQGPISVGATNNKDEIATFSNFGKCVDIFAPGVDIDSTSIWSNSVLMSGTSMASPHVAGLLSYYLSLQPSTESEFYTNLIEPETLKKLLIRYGTKGRLLNLVDGESPNVLAYNGAGGNLTEFWNH